MRRFKRFSLYTLSLILLILFVLLGSDFWVKQGARGRLYDEVEAVPEGYTVGLVLGTSPKTREGQANLFFRHRIEAAAELFRAGKVQHFILSGDNRTIYYDEPNEMKAALIAAGIPASAITLDYAGFRTLDSIMRLESVFDQKKVLVVSQLFHNERALFIAQAKGIEAIAYNARAVSVSYAPKTYLREYLARVLAIMDLYILGTEPKFNGPKEPLVL